MSFLIEYRGQPVKFNAADAPRLIGEIVPRYMATPFDSADAAMERARLQFGDVGLEHCQAVPKGVK